MIGYSDSSMHVAPQNSQDMNPNHRAVTQSLGYLRIPLGTDRQARRHMDQQQVFSGRHPDQF